MARLLAIEWDEREARVAVATPHGEEVVVEDAFAIDISAATAADAADDASQDNASQDDASQGNASQGNASQVGRCIAQALAARGLTGGDVLVGLGRTSIELRSISLPPAPPEELPDMVRFQAMQAFAAISEDWPLDFVELGAQDGTLQVLAAVVSPKQVEQILRVCAAAELAPRCLVLRPFAAASLLSRGDVLAEGRNALMVDMLADGADLTAISRGQVVFMRTVRRPATDDPAVQARALVGEARRTIGAAQAQMGGQRIEQVIICGSESEHPELMQALADALSLEVVRFDPFRAVRLARGLERQLPADAGRYTPLLGMLADVAAGVPHAIDFLNPRKRPVPRSNRQRNVLIAAGSLAAVGVVVLGVWGGLKYLDRQIADLNAQVAELDKQVAAARELMADVDAVSDFVGGDVTWLDELHELARRMPGAEQIKLNDVTITTGNVKRGGVIALKGHVQNADVIARFEDSLRYEDHVVRGRSAIPDQKSADYPYALDTTVTVEPDTYDRGRSLGRPFRDKLRAAADADTPARAPTGTPDADADAQPAQTTEGDAA